MNMSLYVIVLINIWKKQRMNLFYKFEHKNKIKLFSHNETKNQPRT